MGLERRASKHQTAASQHEAVVSEHYADFAVGDRVDTVDGFLGTVTDVQDGPFPGTEQYLVTLDDDMGGGEYDASQLTKVHTTQAVSEDAQRFAEGVMATYEALGEGGATAATDYPELAEILVQRPPLAHAEPLAMYASKTTVAPGDRVSLPDGNQGTVLTTDPNSPNLGVHQGTEYSVCVSADPTEDFPDPVQEIWRPRDVQKVGSKTASGRPEGSTECTVCDGNGWLDLSSGEIGVKWERTTCNLCQGHGYLLPGAKEASADSSISEGADEHVFIATAGLWDRVLDKTMRVVEDNMKPEYRADHETGSAPSYDWCRFRKNRRCMFPKQLNEPATRAEGYAVWIPEDRGLCERDQWALQKTCPVSQPGPKSGEPGALVDATVRWEDGGQRGGKPNVYPVDFANPFEGSKKTAAFEFTATWADVRAKARKIRTEGGVRIVAVPGSVESGLTITAEINGDQHIYETTLIREPGKQSVASWSCGCAWAAYSWGRSGRWKKFEGRMCSHALALAYEAQAQGIFGRTINEQPNTPPWRTSEPVTRYEKNPLGLAASLRPVALDAHLQAAPAALIAQAMLAEGHSKTAVVAAFGDERIIAQAVTMAFPDLKALVRGVVRTVKYVFSDEHSALVEGVGKVSLEDILYPTYHPTKGLDLPRMASLAEIQAHVQDGRDGAHIPGTDEHYPYDEQWADPSAWGRNHFGFVGDDLFVFEQDISHEMQQGDPAGAASFVGPEMSPVTVQAERIDIGGGREVPFGHLDHFDPGLAMSVVKTDDPFGFEDPLNDYNDPDVAEPALPFTEGSLAKQAYFDIADDATVEQAADAVIDAAATRANFVTRRLMDEIADLNGLARLDMGPDGQIGYRVKKKKRTMEKIEQDVREKHKRPDQIAESFSDALRFTILLAPDAYADGANEIMGDLAAHGIKPDNPGRVKNFWLRGDPYDGINAVLRLPDGFPFEIQFHTDQSLRVKMANHVEYDEYRDKATTPERRKVLWEVMVGRTHLLMRAPGESEVGVHKFQGSKTAAGEVEFYYGFTHRGEISGVFRRVDTPTGQRFERFSNSAQNWVEDAELVGHLVKGSVDVQEITREQAEIAIALTRHLHGAALLAKQAKVEHLHAEALVVDAIADPATAPEMAEAVAETLTSSPPGPGDPRLAWLMSGASAGPGAESAGGGSPQNASDSDIAAQAKAHLAKQALKEFSPAEQQAIINEGMDVVASNLEDLDIRGTHYEGLEAALKAHEDDEEWLQ